jgi:broad specificity phosphatase PhoE
MRPMNRLPARLYLVRHGETDWNRERRFQGTRDVPLNDLGRAQSRALADRLAGLRLDAVYTSPLLRAAETARIVAERHGLAPVEMDDLREFDMGRWSGLSYPEVQALHPAELARMEAGEGFDVAGGETAAQVSARMAAALDEIGRNRPGADVLVVSHGMALKSAVCGLLGVDLRFRDRLTTGGNTGLTVFETMAGVPRMTVYACTRHLDDARTASDPSK